ncbi:MAG TPA: DNA gyrase inhibitor YacG [Novosphingobium sp.]|nr:DNA gyrase inhibitor YacG [Novosphingobium sp.]
MTSPRKKCPICGKPRVDIHAPFCSARCRDRDLNRWLDDGYALPGPPADPDGPSDIAPED